MPPSVFTPYAGRRVALVTGAGSGIGRSIALRLASDGYSVGLNDIPGNKEVLEALSAEIEKDSVHPDWEAQKVAVLCADVTDEDAVKEMVEGCVRELGRLDVMVANAGIGAAPEPIYEATLKNYRRVWSVNVEGVLFCYKYASIQMIKQGNGGRIIGASSIVGKKGYKNFGSYSTSKFAIRALTQTSAQELDEFGITVNAYAPGLINTPMANAAGSADAVKEAMGLFNITLGVPDDIANWVSYVASPQSQFMTGQSTIIDGGIHFD